MKARLLRIILILALAEIAYLGLANLVLNLDLTRTLINQHRPEKYQVHWQRAWSWYPLRLQAAGISANGQTSSTQWQAEISSASASVAVLPLLRRTVELSRVRVRDTAFRLRPRPKPDRDYAAIRAFFPPIQGRDPESPAVAREPRGEGSGWKILADGAEARGRHDFWLFQVRGELDGALRADASFETRGGPFSLSAGEADVTLESLRIREDRDVSSGAKLQGRFALAPFVPADNPGRKALGFLTLDAEVDAPVGSLAFLDFYLRSFDGMRVDGEGRLRGRLSYEQGNLTAGTDLAIDATKLELTAASYEVEGDGEIDIAVDPEDPNTLGIGIEFGDLQALRRGDRAPLFTGSGLEVLARGTSRVLPDEARERGGGRLGVRIPSVQVPDLGLYQRFIPQRWDLELKGGQGSLQGSVDASRTGLDVRLNLASDHADLRLKEFRFGANLDLGLSIRGADPEAAAVDVSGTYLRLDQARLASADKGASEPWQAAFTIASGTLGIPAPAGNGEETGLGRLSRVFRDQGLKEVLAAADAQLAATLTVSDLGWVNLLFRNPFDLTISGAGEVATNLRVHAGWLAAGTTLQVRPRRLEVQVLDYVARGRGVVVIAVERGGAAPDMRLEAKLGDARLRRRGEDEAVVDQVSMEVSARATGVALGGGTVAALDLRVPSARVTDMRVYNQYLPRDAPVRLLAGQANLAADLRLAPESADGFVKLETSGLRARLDEQEVSGALTLDVKLAGGVPRDMDFDISGSSLVLDHVKVAGGQQRFDQADWRARLGLREARVVWQKPVRLDLKAEVQMKDSRPIIALFANQRGKNGWLEKILQVENVQGEAELRVARERVLVPYALVGGEKIDVGAKALIDSERREGIFYARFGKLKGILKLRDGERNFDILRAQETFEAYTPGETALVLGGGDRTRSAAQDTARGKPAETARPAEKSGPAGSDTQQEAFGSFATE